MKGINVLFGTGTALTRVYWTSTSFGSIYSVLEVSPGVQTSTKLPEDSTV